MKKTFIAAAVFFLLPYLAWAQRNIPVPMVYISGSYQEKHYGPSKACYWINGSMQQVNGISVDAITTYKGRVYSAGIYSEKNNSKTCCYWIEETPYPLPGCISVVNISVVNGTVYVTGNYKDDRMEIAETCYWVNGVRQPGPTDGFLNSGKISVVNGAVYTSGFYKVGNTCYACYWKDGVRHDLPNNQNYLAVGMEVVNGRIYVGAVSTDLTKLYQACYWIDNIQYIITDTKDLVNQDFVISNGNVYMFGEKNYWVNGVRHDYKAVGYKGIVFTFAYNNVYIAGAFTGLGENDSCYWENEKRFNLYSRNTSFTYCNIKAIYVTEFTLPQ